VRCLVRAPASDARADATHVAALLRPVDRAEMEALEGRSAADVLAGSIATAPRVLTIHQEPMMLYGVVACADLPGNAIPWAATTSTIEHDDLITIMWMSRFQVDAWQRRWPTLQAVSTCATSSIASGSNGWASRSAASSMPSVPPACLSTSTAARPAGCCIDPQPCEAPCQRPCSRTAAGPSIGRCRLRHDLIPSLRQLIRRELTLLHRLASDRRNASARMPALIRTGPTASPPAKPIIEPTAKPSRTT
jgi:hypothetical protein